MKRRIVILILAAMLLIGSRPGPHVRRIERVTAAATATWQPETQTKQDVMPYPYP
jgi:hypothetical protein